MQLFFKRTKTCSYCGEKIKLAAIKCRYCHSDLSENGAIEFSLNKQSKKTEKSSGSMLMRMYVKLYVYYYCYDGNSTPKYAGFWRRLAARVLDGIFISTLILAYRYIDIKSGHVPSSIDFLSLYSNSRPNIFLVSFGLGFAYEAFFIYRYGATLGRKIVGIKVVSFFDESKPSLMAIFIRQIFPLLAIILFPLLNLLLLLILAPIELNEKYLFFALSLMILAFMSAYLMQIYTKNRQTLFDKISKTIVLKNNPIRTIFIWLINIFFIVMIIVMTSMMKNFTSKPISEVNFRNQPEVSSEDYSHTVATLPELKNEIKPITVLPLSDSTTYDQEEFDALRDQYGILISREIEKYKQYPKIAQIRDSQGDVTVEIQMDDTGNIISTEIQTSSGFNSLDKEALDMIKRAAPLLPMPPSALKAKALKVLVPLSFRLE